MTLTVNNFKKITGSLVSSEFPDLEVILVVRK
ncbi:MAG: hypothetical protein UV46_C0035G0009 [Candidatus Gottesmanbacteria bacterium GW2011_GWC2_42_8]|nr:MAG: hypothetical protein UV46_C0035G0009 [Candidatus Gottesmanbacteria bacterium GW2011_GWC2_42_8]